MTRPSKGHAEYLKNKNKNKNKQPFVAASTEPKSSSNLELSQASHSHPHSRGFENRGSKDGFQGKGSFKPGNTEPGWMKKRGKKRWPNFRKGRGPKKQRQNRRHRFFSLRRHNAFTLQKLRRLWWCFSRGRRQGRLMFYRRDGRFRAKFPRLAKVANKPSKILRLKGLIWLRPEKAYKLRLGHLRSKPDQRVLWRRNFFRSYSKLGTGGPLLISHSISRFRRPTPKNRPRVPKRSKQSATLTAGQRLRCRLRRYLVSLRSLERRRFIKRRFFRRKKRLLRKVFQAGPDFRPRRNFVAVVRKRRRDFSRSLRRVGDRLLFKRLYRVQAHRVSAQRAKLAHLVYKLRNPRRRSFIRYTHTYFPALSRVFVPKRFGRRRRVSFLRALRYELADDAPELIFGDTPGEPFSYLYQLKRFDGLVLRPRRRAELGAASFHKFTRKRFQAKSALPRSAGFVKRRHGLLSSTRGLCTKTAISTFGGPRRVGRQPRPSSVRRSGLYSTLIARRTLQSHHVYGPWAARAFSKRTSDSENPPPYRRGKLLSLLRKRLSIRSKLEIAAGLSAAISKYGRFRGKGGYLARRRSTLLSVHHHVARYAFRRLIYGIRSHLFRRKRRFSRLLRPIRKFRRLFLRYKRHALRSGRVLNTNPASPQKKRAYRVPAHILYQSQKSRPAYRRSLVALQRFFSKPRSIFKPRFKPILKIRHRSFYAPRRFWNRFNSPFAWYRRYILLQRKLSFLRSISNGTRGPVNPPSFDRSPSKKFGSRLRKSYFFTKRRFARLLYARLSRYSDPKPFYPRLHFFPRFTDRTTIGARPRRYAPLSRFHLPQRAYSEVPASFFKRFDVAYATPTLRRSVFGYRRRLRRKVPRGSFSQFRRRSFGYLGRLFMRTRLLPAGPRYLVSSNARSHSPLISRFIDPKRRQFDSLVRAIHRIRSAARKLRLSRSKKSKNRRSGFRRRKPTRLRSFITRPRVFRHSAFRVGFGPNIFRPFPKFWRDHRLYSLIGHRARFFARVFARLPKNRRPLLRTVIKTGRSRRRRGRRRAVRRRRSKFPVNLARRPFRHTRSRYYWLRGRRRSHLFSRRILAFIPKLRVRALFRLRHYGDPFNKLVWRRMRRQVCRSAWSRSARAATRQARFYMRQSQYYYVRSNAFLRHYLPYKRRRHRRFHPRVGRARVRQLRIRRRRYGSLRRRFQIRLRRARKRRLRRKARRYRYRRRKLIKIRYWRSRRRRGRGRKRRNKRRRRRRGRFYRWLPTALKSRHMVYFYMRQVTNNFFYSIFYRRRLLATYSNGRTEFVGSRRTSGVACESAAKRISIMLRANRIRAIFFVFDTRFNYFKRAVVRVFRARRFRIAGFKYYMRRPHGFRPRKRASRRV